MTATSDYQTSFTKPNGIYIPKCPAYGTPLFSSSQSPENWPSCKDAYDYTWKNDPDNEILGLSETNRLKLAHSMGFCPHLRCQLGNLSSPIDARRGHCSKGLCYTKLENGSPSFGACCFVNGSFDSGDLIGFYDPQIVATQCPMRRTLADVKNLIRQERISLWIQLTAHSQLSEQHDCHLLPDAWDSSEIIVASDHYHQKRVDSLSNNSNFRFANFSFVGEDLAVQHVWYSTWEDFTKPADEDYRALDYITSLAVSHISAGNTIAINCFSGRGRTGTFAALVLGKLHHLKDDDSLVDLIVSLGEHRDGLVEIPAQYRFLTEMLGIPPSASSHCSQTLSTSDYIDASSFQWLVWIVLACIILFYWKR